MIFSFQSSPFDLNQRAPPLHCGCHVGEGWVAQNFSTSKCERAGYVPIKAGLYKLNAHNLKAPGFNP
jgi:hypothetical protein